MGIHLWDRALQKEMCATARMFMDTFYEDRYVPGIQSAPGIQPPAGMQHTGFCCRNPQRKICTDDVQRLINLEAFCRATRRVFSRLSIW